MDGRIKCPACGKSFSVETDLELGETMSCPHCDADLRIVGMDPMRVEERYTAADSYDNYS